VSVAGLSSRRRRIIIIAAVVVVVAVVVAAVVIFVNSGSNASGADDGGDNPKLSAQDVATEFLDALGQGAASQAGPITDDPAGATGDIKTAFDSLKPQLVSATDVKVSTKNATATVTYTLTWNFGQGHTWSDPSSFAMKQDKTGTWLVTWLPAILAPKLQPGDQLKRSDSTQATAPTVLSGDGTPLLASTQVTAVTVNPSAGGDIQQTAAKLSAALSQFDSTITTQSIVTQAASGSSFVLVNLRQSDYDKVKAQLSGMAGVTFPEKTELLGPTKNFAAAILPTIRNVASGQTTQGTQSGPLTVYIQNADGSPGDTVYTTAAPGSTISTATTINTSLNIRLQTAAEAALNTVSQQGMAVIIQPSTGKILAVADNAAASSANLNPLTGLYPPGSTFKIVTAATALSQGKITPQTSVACPGTTSIEGRTISNEDKFDLGTTSITTAFARSCNTTFSQVATQLGPNDLPAMAKQFGIGVDYRIPNITTNTGHIPADADTLARGEDGFGQGQDQVSVFAMALAAATAEHGSTPVPSLIAGQTTQSDTSPTSIGSSTMSSLKTLMRAVVTSGTATAVAHVSPAVYGKTGTAQFGDGSHSHGWFVGYQGDMAFAFLVVDGGSSLAAVQVTNSFFANGG
jgi:cell division protein FtsI/penicillin-binding protein 2